MWADINTDAPKKEFMIPQHKLQTLQPLRILKISGPDMQDAHIHTYTNTHKQTHTHAHTQTHIHTQTQQRSCGEAEDTAGLAAWGSQQKVSRDKAVRL